MLLQHFVFFNSETEVNKMYSSFLRPSFKFWGLHVEFRELQKVLFVHHRTNLFGKKPTTTTPPKNTTKLTPHKTTIKNQKLRGEKLAG